MEFLTTRRLDLPSVASVSLAAIVDWARVESGLADEVDGVGFPALVAAPVLLAMSATMARLTPRGGCQRIRPYHLLLICFVAPVFAMGAGAWERWVPSQTINPRCWRVG